ncbi:MAG TPA: hypothetical protein VH328_01465, partial [Burkholderiaceae bacterium]|nr:hypothetical protein [Burkholderiaceae bacterium]
DADLDNGVDASSAATSAPDSIVAAAPDGEDEQADDGSSAQITVPNFRGLTIAAALRVARQSGVQLAFDEARAPMGIALAQAPAPGPAQRGVVCRVSFGRPE